MNVLSGCLKYLPLRLSCLLSNLPFALLRETTEIRLRRDAPLSITAGSKNITVDETGSPCKPEKAVRATEREITECVALLSENSLYAVSDFMPLGFIPLKNGGRAGICGRIIENGKTSVFGEIFSVCIRIPHSAPDFASPLIKEFAENGIRGTIVMSKPGMGKTTFLRSLCRLASSGSGIKPLRVAVADEREEITAGMTEKGLLDIVSGMKKADAIELLTRSMSPELLVCDEISEKETDSILGVQNCGVPTVASVHAGTKDELFRKRGIKTLIESGVFPLFAELSYENGEYICRISETGEKA